MRHKAVLPIIGLLVALAFQQGSQRSTASSGQGTSALTGKPLRHVAAGQDPFGRKAGNRQVTLTKPTAHPKHVIQHNQVGPHVGQTVLGVTVDPSKFDAANGLVARGLKEFAILHHNPDPRQGYSILQVTPDPQAGYSILQAGPKIGRLEFDVDPNDAKALLEALKERDQFKRP